MTPSLDQDPSAQQMNRRTVLRNASTGLVGLPLALGAQSGDSWATRNVQQNRILQPLAIEKQASITGTYQDKFIILTDRKKRNVAVPKLSECNFEGGWSAQKLDVWQGLVVEKIDGDQSGTEAKVYIHATKERAERGDVFKINRTVKCSGKYLGFLVEEIASQPQGNAVDEANRDVADQTEQTPIRGPGFGPLAPLVAIAGTAGALLSRGRDED